MAKNGVGIFVREPLAQEVLDIKRINSRLMWIKLRIEKQTMIIFFAYATLKSGPEKKAGFWPGPNFGAFLLGKQYSVISKYTIVTFDSNDKKSPSNFPPKSSKKMFTPALRGSASQFLQETYPWILWIWHKNYFLANNFLVLWNKENIILERKHFFVVVDISYYQKMRVKEYSGK
ncbi:hypothetical protein HELRODRAFT_180335 [Helobdella robusta]|uniref:Uncharacterized protein n=1 Tax=Helobdella robusta TaxID=6412 RepID=T1FFR8_HELRO|nr:hypothetical protein HELRODRAFT_180335 [Helobdella robusta]ESN93928.1 hypothetical protein HELRODRAFT_180335 [Helobdella robusta]